MTASDRTRPRRRTRRRLWRRIVLLIFVVALVAVPTSAGPPSRPATLAPAAVRSGFERSGNASIARDCGYSAALPASPGHSLWLFCDTAVYARVTGAKGHVSWALRQFITGSTAAAGLTVAGRGPADRTPGQLSEVSTPGTAVAATPDAAPAPFLPAPAGLVTATGLPCGSGGASSSYAASWISGVTRVPRTPDLLIAFNNYCVLGGAGGFLPEGFGLVEYDPATGTLSNNATVFSGTGLAAATAAKLLGSPVFSGPYLYLFGPTCTALAHGKCATGTLLEARVPASALSWTDPLSYQWRSHGLSGSWTPDPAAATSIIPGAAPSGVSVAGFPSAGRHFVLVEQTDITGAFTVYGAPAPDGPWTRIRSGRVACRAGAGFANLCRAIIGQPGLSTPSQLVLSYFDPAQGPHGHVMVTGFRW
jgi:hypothetical protein